LLIGISENTHSGLLEAIRRDLQNLYGPIDCLEPLNQHLRLQSVRLNLKQKLQIVHTTGTCLAGTQNGPILIYTSSRQEWNLLLEARGQSIRHKSNPAALQPDLFVQEHLSSTESTQIHYRFVAGKYRPIACQELYFREYKTGKISNRPHGEACGFDWESNLKER
jgi:hypothetical protein